MDIRKYFLLAALAMYSGGCFTRTAMRSFDRTLADDSILTVEQSTEQPASFHYEITTDATYKGVGWEARLSGSGEVRLADEITSRCSKIAMYVWVSLRPVPLSGEGVAETDCRELSAGGWANLPFGPPAANSPTGRWCRLPETAVPECSVILVRSTSTDAPVAAYRASDWSPLVVATQPTPDRGRWLKLAVSPFLDIGAAAVLVVAFAGVGMSAM